MEVALVDPGDERIVSIEWSDVIPEGVTLVSVLHIVPTPLTAGAPFTDTGAKRSGVKVSGVVHGGLYMIEAEATLSNGEKVNRQFPLRGWNS